LKLSFIHALNLSHHILNYFSEVNTPDILVSLGRGGMVVTRLVSECTNIHDIKLFNIKCYNCDDKLSKVTTGSFNYTDLNDKSVVLIDDVYTTGTTIDTVTELIQKNTENCSIDTATLYWNIDNLNRAEGKIKRPNVYSGTYSASTTWLVFPWEKIGDVFHNYQESQFT
jgi:hypoxanthine phosphoribosyltransferase